MIPANIPSMINNTPKKNIPATGYDDFIPVIWFMTSSNGIVITPHACNESMMSVDTVVPVSIVSNLV